MDSLGDRMKNQYESRTRYMLPRRTFTIIRLDGKAFHTLTRGYVRPFDDRIMMAMTAAARAVLDEAQGAKLAYLQSNEISIVLTDFDRIETQAWFDGNVQKIVSVSAGLASAAFSERIGGGVFDARVFTIPDPIEVENYFIWRQRDSMRNSVSACAQARFSPAALHGKDVAAMKLMLAKDGAPWEAVQQIYRNGWCITRQLRFQRELGPASIPRWSWVHDPLTPVFTEQRSYLREKWAALPQEPVVTSVDEQA